MSILLLQAMLGESHLPETLGKGLDPNAYATGRAGKIQAKYKVRKQKEHKEMAGTSHVGNMQQTNNEGRRDKCFYTQRVGRQ